jgi:hypothetical protein
LEKGPASVDARPDPSIDMQTPPLEQANAMTARDYFGLAAALLRVHPPHATDWSMLARLRRIGLRPGQAFDYDLLEPATRQALDSAPADAVALLHANLPNMARVVNGWQMNIDTMGVYGNHYYKRATITLIGLGANPPEDAVYPIGVTDADGRPLEGERDYLLRFDRQELPPVGAFWSLTMYDADGFQAANLLDRFAIDDRDQLVYNADGSLDLYSSTTVRAPTRSRTGCRPPAGPRGDDASVRARVSGAGRTLESASHQASRRTPVVAVLRFAGSGYQADPRAMIGLTRWTWWVPIKRKPRRPAPLFTTTKKLVRWNLSEVGGPGLVAKASELCYARLGGSVTHGHDTEPAWRGGLQAGHR